MALSPGDRLGPYEILSAIGAGGMGEVYRARDTKLNRDVALKILPDVFAADPERLARFTREAQTLAALNHPHIAHIHGLEESGDVRALVMELVEGEDLAQRIARGAIPLDEALPIAAQIADALEAAHEQGIIHRDLKPANIKVRPDGTVKVLDFGLARAIDPLSSSPAGAALANSPTLTSPAVMGMTGVGVILGTAAYMSPEQAKGRPVDTRADIWAFGCVVYEMLSGRRAFKGADVSDTLVSVFRDDPEWSALSSDTPPRVVQALRVCLRKDPKQRVRDISAVRLAMDGAFDSDVQRPATLAPIARAPRSRWHRAAVTITVPVATAVVVGIAVWFVMRPNASRVTRTTITPTGTTALTVNGNDRDIAISPDGARVVYVGNGGTQLFVRALDALEPLAIVSGGGPRAPFISPDGQWVGFFDGTLLRKVAVTGGPPITVATVGGGVRGATWMPDDTVIFGSVNQAIGLQRVSADGGTPELLARPDVAHGELSYQWPEVLPGGRAVLFTITSLAGGRDAAQVVVRDLRTGAHKVLIRGGSHGYYVPTGHLVYVAAGTLRAIRFDVNRMETRGTAVPAVPRLATTGGGAGNFALAGDGTLVYVDQPGSFLGNGRTLVWVDRTGKEAPIAVPPRAYEFPSLSPDGSRVAVSIADQEDDIWIGELGRATLTRLTLDASRDWFPVWTPDGRRVVFSSTRSGAPSLWWQAADGTGAAEQLTPSSHGQFVTGITPDGKAVVFNEQMPNMGRDLMQLALDGSRRVTPLLQTRFDERNGIVSPDGRWLAYESNSSGAFEIYVRPYPDVGGGQWEVSTAGGIQPLWSRNGKELFYVGGDGTLLGVPVEASGQKWQAGTPIKLLDRRSYSSTGTGRTYDVSPDGQRFLMIKATATDAGAAPPALIVVQHWDEELKRLVPTK